MRQSILFAIYKNNEFQGFRQDTFGTIGKDYGKIYMYSPEQIEIVLNNIKSNLTSNKTIGDVLGNPDIAKAERRINKEIRDKVVFDVRVIEGPKYEYEKTFNVNKAEYETSLYPTFDEEDCRRIFSNPEEQRIIETHHFSLHGELNMS